MGILQGIKLKDDETVHQLDYESGVGNKPFGVLGSTEVDVLPSQSLEFSANEEFGNLYTNVGTGAVLVAGEKYIISWDGTEYEATAFSATFGGTDGVGVGNASIMAVGENTGEPFIIGYVLANSLVITVASGTESSHTVRIHQLAEDVKQIDSKYVDAYTREETSNLIASAITSALNTEV